MIKTNQKTCHLHAGLALITNQQRKPLTSRSCKSVWPAEDTICSPGTPTGSPRRALAVNGRPSSTARRK